MKAATLALIGAKKGASRYFVITLLVCDNNTVVKQISKAVQRTLKNKVNASRQSSVLRHELKGTNTTLAVKAYFQRQMPPTGWRVYSITLHKQDDDMNQWAKEDKPRLYNRLANQLMQKALPFHAGEEIHLIVDRSKSRSEIQDFNAYTTNQLQGIMPLSTPMFIVHENSQRHSALQAVDLFCYGIARKAYGDHAWHEMFKENVALEIDFKA